jgi:hypothetical protein
MIVVTVGPQHQELLAGEEGGSSVAQSLRHSGKGHAYRSDTVFEIDTAHQLGSYRLQPVTTNSSESAVDSLGAGAEVPMQIRSGVAHVPGVDRVTIRLLVLPCVGRRAMAWLVSPVMAGPA